MKAKIVGIAGASLLCFLLLSSFSAEAALPAFSYGLRPRILVLSDQSPPSELLPANLSCGINLKPEAELVEDQPEPPPVFSLSLLKKVIQLNEDFIREQTECIAFDWAKTCDMGFRYHRMGTEEIQMFSYDLKRVRKWEFGAAYTATASREATNSGKGEQILSAYARLDF